MKGLRRSCLEFGFLALGVCSVSAFGKTQGNALVIEGFVTKGLFLYDLPSNDGTKVRGQPTPDRVHIRYEPKFSDWVFVISDSYGRFPKPAEVLIEGSVVAGPLIGGLPGEQYEFVSGGGWVRTNEPRTRRLVVLDRVPRFKVISYSDANTRKMTFINRDFALDLKGNDPLARR